MWPTNRGDKQMWDSGEIEGYNYNVHHYKGNSIHGINGGRITKLFIGRIQSGDLVDEDVFIYEKDMFLDNLDEKGREVYTQLIEKYN